MATITGFWDNEHVRTACDKIGKGEGEQNQCWLGLRGPYQTWADGVYSMGYGKFSAWAKSKDGLDPNRWRLILRLKDVTKGYFSQDIRVSGVENPSDAEANTYSIIGSISPDEYKDTQDKKWEFKLVYVDLDGEDRDIIWKQSSWLDARSISGYEAVEVPGQVARFVFLFFSFESEFLADISCTNVIIIHETDATISRDWGYHHADIVHF